MYIFKLGFFGLLLSAAFSNITLGAGISGAPAPFDRGGVKIALVSYLSQGDYFEAFEAGVARQAKALDVDLRIFQGKQDAAQQREQIEQAISLGVEGLIVSHGQPESLKDVVQKALDAGIKVVAKDVDLGNPRVRPSQIWTPSCLDLGAAIKQLLPGSPSIRESSCCPKELEGPRRSTAFSLDQFPRRGRAKLRLSRGFTLGFA
jgi:Periplasmic binding protein domain